MVAIFFADDKVSSSLFGCALYVFYGEGMKLIANGLNGNYLRDILPTSDQEVDSVMAAIAYGSMFPDQNSDLIGHCLANKYRLDIWMRYDHTVPVSPELLRRILRHHKDNIFCLLIPDRLHSKIIWWKGYGAYIGSANLTDRAWVSNVETGVFLSDSDLEENGMNIELENFFEELRAIPATRSLDKKIIEELEKMQIARRTADKSANDLSEKLRTVPVWQGPVFFEKKKAKNHRREKFKNEWLAALTHLSTIGELLVNRKPDWIPNGVPLEWQVDQFLHAYYYNHVGEDRRKPYEDFYQRNKKDPKKAVLEVIEWWEQTPSPPSHEDDTFFRTAPLLKSHLSREKILTLSEIELEEVCEATHATRDHVIKIKLSTLGRPGIKSLSREERLSLFAKWLINQVNPQGWNVLELLNFVLYGGSDDEVLDRLYSAGRDRDFLIPHYGLNSIAEAIGWARPEIISPRNGRTSKALRAFGYDVKVY